MSSLARTTVDWRTSLSLIGTVTKALTLPLVGTALVAAAYREPLAPFVGPAALTLSAGSALERLERDDLGLREGYLMVALTWFVIAVVGALPFLVAGDGVLATPINALFESTSGVTTTGATVVDSFDAAVSDMEGAYTADAGLASAGYEIRDASAEWGEVTEPTSNMTLTFEIHNPGDVPVPLVPDGFRLNATGNGVPLFTASGDALTPQNVPRDATLAPGETETVNYTVSMDNENIDEWFVSHVRNDEQTDFVIKPQLEFEVPDTDVGITIPRDGPGYRCSLQTAILVDNQSTETTCGSGGSAGA